MTAIFDRADRNDRLAAEQDSSAGEVRFAAPAVIAIAVVTGLILLVRAGRYEYFGDELYFVAAGNHLAPGYADQGPLVPLLARVAWTLAPGSVVTLRIPSILAAVAGVLAAGACAREMGGRRRAQVLAALAGATCPYLITQAASLSTFALDSALSAAALWLLARWTRLRRDRLLIGAATVIAVDLEVKLLAVVLVAGIIVGVAVCGPRELLSRPALWWSAPVLMITVLPGMFWQQRHGWPQLAMGAVIRAEQRAATGGVLGLPVQWALLTGLLGGLLALCGWWALLRHSGFRSHRWIGIAAVVTAVFVIVSGGRPYYVAGMFPALFAAGAAAIPDLRHRAARTAGAAVVAVSVAISLTVVSALPLTRADRPVRSQAELSTRMRTFGTSGWSRLVGGVDAAYRAVAPGDRAGVVVLTQTYWQAAALDELGPPGHPPVYSADRGYAYFGSPAEAARIVLYVGAGASDTLPHNVFEVADPVVRIDDPFGFPGIDHGVRIWRCRHPRRPWSVLWPNLTTLVLDPGL